MSGVEEHLQKIHPATATGALLWLGITVALGVAGTSSATRI